MKYSLQLLTLSIALMLGATLTPGCKSANTTGYKVTKAAQVTVEQAVGAWNDYLGVQRSHIATLTPEAAEVETSALKARERQVKAAYAQYQSAVAAVSSAGAAYTRAVEQNAGTDTAKARFDVAIAASSAAFADLLTLIQQFGVTITK